MLDWKRFILAAASTLMLCTASRAEPVPMAELIRQDVAAAAQHYRSMLAQVQQREGFPRTVQNGEIKMVSVKDWTAGFFPGSLWLLAEATGDASWRTAAQRYTEAVAPAKFDASHHDLGFMLYSSFGNGLRLGADPVRYRDALLAGATTLVTRFQPRVGAIQSWGTQREKDWRYPVIIDNMMNLELLLWAAKAAQEPYYRSVALAHADTTLRNHFRADGSSYHLVDYDPATGAVRSRVTVQGLADSSAWARGQAWALYGYSMMYRETGRAEYLAQARRVAAFLMQHPRMPADKIPYWDFDDPAQPDAPRDSSAAAIMASALIELSQQVEGEAGRAYLAYAEAQLRSLSTPAYLAAAGSNGNFLLLHGTGHKPAHSEIDVPLVYGDYYFLEALLRYRTLLAGSLQPSR